MNGSVKPIIGMNVMVVIMDEMMRFRWRLELSCSLPLLTLTSPSRAHTSCGENASTWMDLSECFGGKRTPFT